MPNIRTYILRAVPSIILGALSLSSFIFPLPEVLKAMIAASSLIIFPILLGNAFLTLGLTKISESLARIGLLSRLLICWLLGSYFLLIAVYLLHAVGIVDFRILPIIVFVILFSDLLNPNTFFAWPKLFPRPFFAGLRQTLGKRSVFWVVLLLLVSISSLVLFRMHQPYPTYSTSEFSYFQKPLQLIDASKNIRLYDNTAYPVVSVQMSLVSFNFNVHPLPVIWIFAFLQATATAVGVYLTSRILFKNKLASLIAAFLTMWIFAGASYQNNPSVVSNDNFQYAVFALSIFLLVEYLQRNDHDNRVSLKSWLGILGIPMLIFIQRTVIGYTSVPLALCFLTLPFVYLLLNRKNLLGGRNQFAFTLFLIFVSITIIHQFMAPLYIILLISLVILWKFAEKERWRLRIANIRVSVRKLVLVALLAGMLIFFLVQISGVVDFQNHFTLSSSIFGSTYVDQIGIDVGFSTKVTFFIRGNPILVTAFFVIGLLVLVIYSFQNHTQDVVIVALSSIALFLYFFPESFFARARYVVPFFALVMAGGIARLLEVVRTSHKMSRYASAPKLFAMVAILLITSAMLVESTSRIVSQVSLNSNQIFSTFETYEYDAGSWLRSEVDQINRSDTILISDPYTMNLMSSLTNLNIPYQKQWINTVEYSADSLRVLNNIHNLLNSYNFYDDLSIFLEQQHVSTAYIIVNGRTTKWLSQNDTVFLYSASGIPWSVNEAYVWWLSKIASKVLYSLPGRVHIFEFDADELTDHTKEVIAGLYSAMYLEANDAYSYAVRNNYKFMYWNVTSDARSTITTSYMSMAPLWVYILTGNTSHLNWAERSLDLLYTRAFYKGLIVPLNDNLEMNLNGFVKIDYSLRFVGASINLYEITGNSTFLEMARKVTDGMLTIYANETTGLLMADRFSFQLNHINEYVSILYLGDYITLLEKMYSHTSNSTYKDYATKSVNHLIMLQNLSPTKLIPDALNSSGYPIRSSVVVPADLISAFSGVYTITKDRKILDLLETQGGAFIKYGFNSTLQRVVYRVDSQTGAALDPTLYESWAYASVGAYSWLYSVTGNATYLNCAQKTFDTYYSSSHYDGLHVSKIGASNEPIIDGSSYLFFGKNYDLPYGFFWLYYSTRNETLRSIFSNLVKGYLTDFKMQYGYAYEKNLSNQVTDHAPALPIVCRNYAIALLFYTYDFSSNSTISTSHQSSYYYGPLLNLDNVL